MSVGSSVSWNQAVKAEVRGRGRCRGGSETERCLLSVDSGVHSDGRMIENKYTHESRGQKTWCVWMLRILGEEIGTVSE